MSRIGMLATVLCAVSMAAGEAQRAIVPVTADVGISSVVGKMRHSNGIGPATPIMQNQNWSGFENKDLLMAFDAGAIKGWTVSKATMHIFLSKGDLYGVGLCTVLSPWREGRALNGVEREGAPCWDFRSTPARDAAPTAENEWAWPGSRFFSVSWSHPAARYSNAGPGQIRRAKTKDGRFLQLSFPVDPALVESLAAGVATGLVLTDDKGQVRESYSLIDSAMPYRYNASEDIWVFTKDIHDAALRPHLEVFGQAIDRRPPAAATDLKVTDVSPGDGSAVLTFTAPGDDERNGQVLAYEAFYSEGPIVEKDLSRAKPLPLWSLPKPVPAGKTQRMPIFTLPPGTYHVAVRGVDEAGNRGPLAAVALTIPDKPDATLAQAGPESPPGNRLVGPQEPKLAVFAVPDTVKIDPVAGGVLRDGAEYEIQADYLRENPISDGMGRAYLKAAANEVVALQVILKKQAPKLTNVRVSVSDLSSAGGRKIEAAANAQTFRLWYVSARGSRRTGRSSWYAAPCLPLKKPFEEGFDIPAADNKVPGQQYQSVWVDLYVPRGTPAGQYSGKISVTADELTRPVALDLAVQVLPLSLPDKLSYNVELNRYHSVVGWAGVDARQNPRQALQTMWDYHRLAHQHRSVLIVLPYSHSGRVDGDAIPVMEGKGTDVRVKDWTEYDRRMGPLLDGSAFSAEAGYVGPGAGVPIDHMYMPFHEAWPIWLDASTYKDWKNVSTRLEFAEYAKKSRRPEVAFTEDYKQGFMRVARQFFQHFQQKGWTRTSLHFYNNNKYYWKVAYFGGMGRGGVCFWLMDEPTDFDDYDTNAFVMDLAHRAYRTANTPKVRMDGRTDVSQPDMARGLWDGIGTVWCIGGFRGYWPTAAARQRWMPGEKHWCYGGGSGIPSAPVQLSQAFLQRWAAGSGGHMPWWNCFGGGAGAWRSAENLAIYYSGRNYAGGQKSYPGPIASVRLKLTRRCQQDIEYLHLLAGCKGWDRHRVRRAVMAYSDDPGAPVLTFQKLTLAKMDELRRRVTATVLAEPK